MELTVDKYSNQSYKLNRKKTKSNDPKKICEQALEIKSDTIEDMDKEIGNRDSKKNFQEKDAKFREIELP